MPWFVKPCFFSTLFADPTTMDARDFKSTQLCTCNRNTCYITCLFKWRNLWEKFASGSFKWDQLPLLQIWLGCGQMAFWYILQALRRAGTSSHVRTWQTFKLWCEAATSTPLKTNISICFAVARKAWLWLEKKWLGLWGGEGAVVVPAGCNLASQMITSCLAWPKLNIKRCM